MPSTIVYCDLCGRMIPASDFEKHAAIHTPHQAVCHECAAGLTPEQRAALTSSTVSDAKAPERHTTVRRAHKRTHPTHATHAANTAGASKGSPLVLYSIAGGIGLGLGLALLILLGGTPAPEPQAPPSTEMLPTILPPAPKAVPSPAPDANDDDDLASIRAMIDPTLSKYADARTALTYFIADNEGSDRGREANALLKEIDSKYAMIADAALASAVAAAGNLVAAKRFGEATSIVRAVGNRFGVGPWYTARGKVRIEHELTRIRDVQDKEKPAATTAALEGGELFRETFDAGIGAWRGEHVTTGLAEGSRGAIRQSGGNGISAPDSWENGLFVFDPDATLQYRFRTNLVHWHQLMVSLRTPGNELKNVFYPRNSQRVDGWETVTCLLSKGQHASESCRGLKVAGMLFMSADGLDVDLTVDDIRITSAREPGADAVPMAAAANGILFEESFGTGLPKGWRGRWETNSLPPASRGAIRQDGGADIESPRTHTGLFTTTADTYVNYTYRLDEGQWHHMAIVLNDHAGKPGRVLFHSGKVPRSSTKWTTLSFPLSSCKGHENDFAGRPVFRIVLETMENKDVNLTVDRIWCTDGPPRTED